MIERMRSNKIDLFFHQGEDGWEDVDVDEAEGIEVSGGSPFAPASDYFGETLFKPTEKILQSALIYL